LKKNFVFKPVGYVRRPDAKHGADWRDLDSECEIEINPEYARALSGLKQFSHIFVFFVFDRRKKTQITVRPEDDPQIPRLGVFATGSPLRPNPLGMTIVRLVGVRKNIVTVRGLDALDATAVIDIKPFWGFEEETSNYFIPAWLEKLWKIYESKKEVHR